MLLIKSISDDPVFNGELEKKYLTERPFQDVLLFYINRPSVIVGRNQLIEAEADRYYCQQHHIEIHKRISGGGTVYHDYGNINYAFIVSKGTVPVLERDFATPVIKALQSFGINATVGQRKELSVGNKKISGTASHITRNGILFHGTLLHRSDLSHLTYALRGNPSIRGKNVASVPGAVVNLNDIMPANKSTEEFLNDLLNFFAGYYQTAIIEIAEGA
ncbi:MAG: lipoate--protein ligase family protein [Tannerella sp.]|jgi:lipoate-protein ligase A|nr:lipoate--protein ligase family protein [Tannerella sp.]